MSIDFKRLSKDGEDFELLCRDLLESFGAKIISAPSRGPDQKKDLIVELESKDNIGTCESVRYLVQCKHKAHSGKSVYETELGDFRSACLSHNVQGYFLITTTIPSTTVNSNLEVVNLKGELKTIIWDGRQVEQKIIRSPICNDLLKKYNLKESIDILFGKTKEILLGEYHLPFKLHNIVDHNDIKGLVFLKTYLDQNLNEVTDYIGYFCVDSSTTDTKINEIQSTYNLTELSLVVEKSDPDSRQLSIKDLYLNLQCFRDDFYQQSMINLSNYCDLNPALIRMLETVVSKIPYKIQPVMINYLEELIKINPSLYGVLIVCEAAKTIAKLDIQKLKKNILDQIKNYESWNQSEQDKILLAGTLISSLGKMEEVSENHKTEMFDLFGKIECEIMKSTLLNYFIQLKVPDQNGLLTEYFEVNAGKEFSPHNHAIGYLRDRVTIAYNRAPLNIDYLKE